MFEQAFKNIDDVLWKDAGCTSELDYTEQSSWLLFLKYLDALEHDKAMAAALEGREYSYILDPSYRWESWAAPKGRDGKIDHNAAQTGDDLIDFVNKKLFPYLQGFKAKASGPNTVEYKIGEIFGEIKNRIQSGYNLREIIDHIDELRFASQSEKHELSHLYEAKIKNMGNAGRNGGEYYTPRPLIRAIVAVTAPKLGETICDPAVGSAGFLCEAFEYLRSTGSRTGRSMSTAEWRALQERTFYGKEKKSLAYVIAIMNMILHGIEAPNILHVNTLAENLADVQEKDRFDIILANPPFGGKERKEVQQNFPIRTGETAFLFLQHFIKVLKAGGRAGIVIKNTFLSNTDNASVSLRRKLLEECNLHTVLDCPGGTFQGAGVKTVVLFFEKGTKTRKVWYYQLDPGRNLGKTNPLNDGDLADFIDKQKTFADSDKSWSVDVASIDSKTFDLSVKNPNGGEEIVHRSPQEIMDEIAALDAESADVLENIKRALNGAEGGAAMKMGWQKTTLGAAFTTVTGNTPSKSNPELFGEFIPLVKPPELLDATLDSAEDGLSEAGAKVARIAPPNSILVSCIGNLGKIGLNTVPVAFNQQINAITPDENQAVPEFMFYQVLSCDFKEQLEALSSGTTVPIVNKSKFNSIQIVLPPLAEQQRIAAKLDALSEETQRLAAIYERKLAALEALKKSLLHRAFSGEL